jgi:hypothetical protein
MSDLTLEALDARIIRANPTDGMYAVQDGGWVRYEALIDLRRERDALRAQLAAPSAPSREAAFRKEGFEAGLKAAMKVIASIGYGQNQDVDEGQEQAFRAVQKYFHNWKEADTSSEQTLSLKSLEGVPQEERDRRRDVEFARRGWAQPSPEAVARAALEWAANCIECGCRGGVCEYPAKCPENDVAELVEAASDPATIAAIITKAGGGE